MIPLFFFDDATIFHDAFTVKTQEDPTDFLLQIERSVEEVVKTLGTFPEFTLFYHDQADLDQWTRLAFLLERARGVTNLMICGVLVKLQRRPDLTPKGELTLMKTPRRLYPPRDWWTTCPMSRW